MHCLLARSSDRSRIICELTAHTDTASLFRSKIKSSHYLRRKSVIPLRGRNCKRSRNFRPLAGGSRKWPVHSSRHTLDAFLPHSNLTTSRQLDHLILAENSTPSRQLDHLFIAEDSTPSCQLDHLFIAENFPFHWLLTVRYNMLLLHDQRCTDVFSSLLSIVNNFLCEKVSLPHVL